MNYLKITLLILILVNASAHSMEMSGCNSDEDEFGKRYPKTMDHMGDSKYDQLKENLPTLAMLTNKQITNMMKMMGPNYYWPISKESTSKNGLLILAHGYGHDGDVELYESMKVFEDDYVTSLGLGMSMMTSKHIACSINEMTHESIDNIFVVPVSSTPFNTLVRQWKYIFKLENDYSYSNVEQIHSNKIKFLEPISDSIYAKKIVLDYANEISLDQNKEVIIIIAHGPVETDDNIKQLKLMNNIGHYILSNSSFADVQSFTLQDDASKVVRDQNVESIKAFIKKSNQDGKRVLMVSNLMSGKGIQKNIESDFAGFNYTFNSKGLLVHPLFKEWIAESIRSQ